MDMYGVGHHDYSMFLLDLGSSDPALMDSPYASRSRTSLIYGSRYYTDDDSPSVSSIKSKSISPPKHRHDGTSPLPLGMDWSPPPHVWDGRNTVWPHDYHSGWSYCVTIPYWTVTPGSRASDFVVFYRVQVGVQAPEGITSMKGVLRRFSDFLKLLSELLEVRYRWTVMGLPLIKWNNDLLSEVPVESSNLHILSRVISDFNDLNLYKFSSPFAAENSISEEKLPPAPSKHPLRSKSKELQEDRRSLLEDWITMLLADIDVSRSLAVATFLELEAAARLSFHESNQNASDGNSSAPSMVPSNQILVASDNSLVSGISVTSDFDGDSACEASELEPPRLDRDNVGVGTDTTHIQDSVNLVKADEACLSKNGGDGISPPKNLGLGEYNKLPNIVGKTTDHNKDNTGASQETPLYENDVIHISGTESLDHASLSRKMSRNTAESEITSTSSNLGYPHAVSIFVPTEEQRKMEKVLTKMQQKIDTSKSDVEELISRLNQELAARQYLSTKVKDLEIELETTNQNKEEMVQQAILIESERVTQMQWDIEELRRKCLELEVKLKHEQEENIFLESTKGSIIQENESLRQELDFARDRVEKLLKQREDSEAKSKYDIKLLAKETRSLRGSQLELRQELNALIGEKADIETTLEEERKRRECIISTNSKLLHECENLRSRLDECSVNFLTDKKNKLIVEASSPSEAVDMLTASDNRIGLLLAEARLLAQDVGNVTASPSSCAAGEAEDKLRKMLTDVFIDNASLRKQINSVLRYKLNMPILSDKDAEETSLKDTVLGMFLER